MKRRSHHLRTLHAVWPSEAEDLTGWVVVHADGNGVGLRMRQLLHASHGTELLEQMREVSEALVQAANHTLLWMLQTSPCRRHGHDSERLVRDFLPIVWAGDDITFAVPARHALDVVRSLAARYAELTADPNGVLGELWGGLTLGIGINAIEDGDVVAAVRAAEEGSAVAKDRAGVAVAADPLCARDVGSVAILVDDGQEHIGSVPVYLVDDVRVSDGGAPLFPLADLYRWIDGYRHARLVDPDASQWLGAPEEPNDRDLRNMPNWYRPLHGIRHDPNLEPRTKRYVIETVRLLAGDFVHD